MAESWKVKGTYFEACNCAAACPCVFLSAPTEGNCTVILAWHIDQGSFGSASLDGLASLPGPGSLSLPGLAQFVASPSGAFLN